MDAWLITWETPSAKPRIAAILPADMSTSDVAKILEVVYAQRYYTLLEQQSYARGETNPYRALITEPVLDYFRIDCGHNPLLEARLVRQLTVQELPDGDARTEKATWEERLASGEWERRTLTQRYKAQE